MPKMRIEDYLNEHREEMLAKAIKTLKANVREKVYKAMAFDTLAKRLGLIKACSDPEVPGWRGEPDDKGRVDHLLGKLVKAHPNIREVNFNRSGRGLAFYPDYAIAREKLYGEIEELLEKAMKELEGQLLAEGLLVEVEVKRFPDDPEDDRTEMEMRVIGTTQEVQLRVNSYSRGAPYTSLDIERSYHSTGLKVNSLELVPVEVELMGELARAELRARIEMQKIRDKAKAKMDEIKARCKVKKSDN